MDRSRFDTIQKLLNTHYGEKEQYNDECYNELIDFKKITKSDHIEHRNERYYTVESYLSLHEYGVYLDVLKKYQDKDTDIGILSTLHDVYQFSKEDIVEICTILARGIPKKRSLCFYGPSNCGKSLLANALLYPYAPGYIQRDGGTNVHWLEHIYRKSFILWEEPSIHMTNIEDTKLLTGGEKIAINRKNKNIIERVNDPAIIITTNREIWMYDEVALLNRMKLFKFTRKISDFYKGYINARQIIRYLVVIHDGRL